MTIRKEKRESIFFVASMLLVLITETTLLVGFILAVRTFLARGDTLTAAITIVLSLATLLCIGLTGLLLREEVRDLIKLFKNKEEDR